MADVFTSTSFTSQFVLGKIDSPVTFGLSMETNQLKVDGIFDVKIPLTGLPLHISIAWFMDRITSG